MKKSTKFIILLISVVIVISIGISITKSLKKAVVAMKYCDSRFMKEKANKFLWLFDSSISSSIKCEWAIGNAEIGKYRFVYTYDNKYRYIVFGDSSLNNISLKNIKDTINNNLFKVEAPNEDNEMGWGGSFKYQAKMCIDSSNKLIINVVSNTGLDKSIDSNVTQLKGEFKEIAIQNEDYQTEYLIKFKNKTATNLLFYKKQGVFYMILVNPFEGTESNYNGVKHLNLN